MSTRGRSPSPRAINGSDTEMANPDDMDRDRSPSLSKPNGTADMVEQVGTNAPTVVVISNLTKNVLEIHLRKIFEHYGSIKKIDLPTYSKTGQNRGKAALEYDKPSSAKTAVHHMHNGQLDGSIIHVELSNLPLRNSRSRSPPRRRAPSPAAPIRNGGIGGRRKHSRSRSRTRSRSRSRRRSYSRSRSRSRSSRRRSRTRSRSRSRSPHRKGYGPPRGAGRFRDSRGGGGYRGKLGGPRGGRGGFQSYRGNDRPFRRSSRSRSPAPRRGPGRGPGRRSPSYERGGRQHRRGGSRDGRRRSRSRSYSSRSRSRSRTRSRSRSRRSYSSMSRSRSRSRSKSRRRSRSRSVSMRDRSVSSRSRSTIRSKSRSRGKSMSRSRSR